MKKILAVIMIGLAFAWNSSALAKSSGHFDERLVIPFDGLIDLRQDTMTLRFGEGKDHRVLVDVLRFPDETWRLTFDIQHVKPLFFDLSAVVQADLKFSGTDRFSREMNGRVSSRYTLVNHKPARDFFLKFSVHDRTLFIDSFLLGALSGSGQLELVGEHRADLAFELISSDLESISDMLRDSGQQVPPVSGVLNGAFSLTGPALKPRIKGRLGLYDGSFQELYYESLLLQFEGTYPLLSLDNSLVTHAEGFSFKIAGTVDLSDLARLPYQARRLRRVPIIAEARDRREWVFKRQTSHKDSVTEMKYFLIKDDRGDAEGVLGFEKKIGF